MKTALVIIAILTMLVGVNCVPKPVAPPAPEQPVRVPVPYSMKPAEGNLPNQSWASPPRKNKPVPTNIPLLEPLIITYPNTSWGGGGGYWYYTPYVPPAPKPVTIFWTGAITVEVKQ
jgi:hypothetical protein